jgi:hypothetical protein
LRITPAKPEASADAPCTAPPSACSVRPISVWNCLHRTTAAGSVPSHEYVSPEVRSCADSPHASRCGTRRACRTPAGLAGPQPDAANCSAPFMELSCVKVVHTIRSRGGTSNLRPREV